MKKEELIRATEEDWPDTSDVGVRSGCSSATTAHRGEIESGSGNSETHRSIVGIPKMSDCMFDSDTTDSPDTELAQSDIQGIDPPDGEGVAEEAQSRCEANEVSPVVYMGIRLE